MHCGQLTNNIFLEVDGMRGLSYLVRPLMHVHINLFAYYPTYL